MQLRVKCPTAHVPDYAAQEQGVNRFLGRDVHTRELTGAEVTVESRVEYLQHLRLGDLVPVDAATAAYAGVKLETPKLETPKGADK